MAFFKFRRGGEDSASTQRPPESIEVMRKRARHRLIGAVVLVLAGVIGFPLLFDTQPRPIAVDIPIEIPDRNKARPLVVPPQAATTSSAAAPAPAVVAKAEPDVAKAETPVEPKTEAKPEPKAPPKPEAKEAAKAEPKAESKPAEAQKKSDDGKKAKALLEGKADAAETAASGGRFVVQAGAFSEAARAQETRQKIEKAGLKTYTQVAETKDGKRIRVRVGPFETRDDADKAAAKIKGLDLHVDVRTLTL